MTDYLASSPLLSSLTVERAEALLDLAREARFGEGEVLFVEGGEADRFYIIGKGTIGLEISAPGKEPLVVQTLGAGDLLGLSWIAPARRWAWSARAAIETTALEFPAADVQQLADNDAELAYQLLAHVAAETARRLHETRVQLLNLYDPRP